MSLSIQPYKGARDFYPNDKRLQKWIFARWRTVVERYGYEEYDAPMLEATELYTSKTSEEIVNEQTYSFIDRGNRNVTIRTEMTPSVSRMVAAKRQELAYPARWYSIPNLWRYERPQRGRLREFWQLNVDIFGIESIDAEFEMLQISDAIMKAFGARRDMYYIKVNSRKLMNVIFREYLRLDDVQTETLIRLIDKMHKVPRSEFSAKLDAVLAPSQREGDLESKIFELLNVKTIGALPEEIQQHESITQLKTLLNLAESTGITNIAFDITLMRGFDYYTDIVFEVFDTHKDNNRAMFGGGRYDGLVGLFGVEAVPTVGFGMGDATLHNFLVLHDLLPKLQVETDLYVALLGNTNNKSKGAIELLREMEINTAVDFSGRKIDKQIKTAAKIGIRYIVIIGEQEITSGQYTLRDLITGEEQTHSIERIATIIKDYRNQN